MRRTFRTVACILVTSWLAATASAATLSPLLQQQLATRAPTDSVGTIIVAFETTSGLSAAHLNVLRGAGITVGQTLPRLGMVAVSATVAQVRQLAAHTAVRSIWGNERLFYSMHQARVLAGVQRLRTDAAFTKANGGLPLSGKGVGVVVNDSGIDGTHADLKFPSHVVQNVQVVTDTDTLSGFTPVVTVENVPNTDTHVGHGTHVAGIIGGTGQASGGRYAGVAPGANLIGTGSGAGLFILNGLGGFEWAIANQFAYNIRVVSNSWGSSGGFNPDSPINRATKLATDLGMVVVFSAGNSGPGVSTHNVYAKAPWVISVGAGTKEGGLVGFSSRGTPAEERLNDDDPNNDADVPTIVATGSGREFDSDAGRFTAAVVSTRSSTNVVANGLTDDAEIPPAFLPFYTQISGTSMACPFTSGTVALMLEADPTLSPAEVKDILRVTASRIPFYEEFEVGSGHVNSYAALDNVLNRAKPYGAVNNPAFNAVLTTTPVGFESFVVNFMPQAPGPNSTNTHRFVVEEGTDVLDVSIDFGNMVATDETGNTMGLQLYAPDGAIYASGLALPVLNASDRRIRVAQPVAGQWIAEVRGVRGLTILPVTSPFGIAIPERVDGRIRKYDIALQDVPDIAGRPDEPLIRTLLLRRRMDILPGGLFEPDAGVTREDFARTLALNVPLRQSLADTPRFNDVTGDLAALAEAVTAKGSTLRDFDFTPNGLMSASGSTFNPAGTVARLDVAVALVRALGKDAQARALAGSTVTSNGQPLTDNAGIPSALRGYVQLALDLGLLQAFPAEVREIAPGQFLVLPGPRFEPATVPTRAGLAVVLDRFSQVFRTQ